MKLIYNCRNREKMASKNGEVSPDEDLITEDKKNAKQLVCKKCKSKILPPKTGFFTSAGDFDLHLMDDKDAKEKVTRFFRVDDMFDFDNLGFSNTVEEVKFLTCADCEIGPIGYHTLTDKKSFVALDRVEHV